MHLNPRNLKALAPRLQKRSAPGEVGVATGARREGRVETNQDCAAEALFLALFVVQAESIMPSLISVFTFLVPNPFLKKHTPGAGDRFRTPGLRGQRPVLSPVERSVAG